MGEKLFFLFRNHLVANIPSLEVLVFKARLGEALGSLIQCGAALPVAGGWNGWALSSFPTQTILWF